MEIIALMMNPAITPQIRREEDLFILNDTARISAADTRAPADAAAAIDRPVKAGDIAAGRARAATAAPSPAPALTPMMCGSASLLRNMLCIWAPDRASAAPAVRAVSTLGSLTSTSILAASELPSPDRAEKMSAGDSLMSPAKRSSTVPAASKIAAPQALARSQARPPCRLQQVRPLLSCPVLSVVVPCPVMCLFIVAPYACLVNNAANLA